MRKPTKQELDEATRVNVRAFRDAINREAAQKLHDRIMLAMLKPRQPSPPDAMYALVAALAGVICACQPNTSRRVMTGVAMGQLLVEAIAEIEQGKQDGTA